MPRKKRQEGSRAPNGAASVYLGNDGRWHGRVTMGVRDNGTPDRRHVSAMTEAEVLRKVRALERARDSGKLAKPGRPWTVEKWLKHWLEHIAAPSVRQNTLSGYRVAVRVHLVPGVGAHRLDRLTPEHLEKLYTRMQQAGSAPGTAHQSHRTMRTALNHAVKRGLIGTNPATLATPPALDEEDVEPYTVEEVQRLMEKASESRNSARWAFALALGLRQGEALGLKWDDIDLEKGEVKISRSRLRPKYTHGCAKPCGRPSGYCPERRQTNADTDATKSRAGRRKIGLPGELVNLIKVHRDEQEKERAKAGDLWSEGSWVFASPTGRPLNPNTDFHEWKALLKEAGLREGRLHDARHTAATVLLALKVQDRAVMGIMGWSSPKMAARYQHVTDPIRKDIAKRVGNVIWTNAKKPKKRKNGHEGDGRIAA